jgi:hypothetical protein
MKSDEKRKNVTLNHGVESSILSEPTEKPPDNCRVAFYLKNKSFPLTECKVCFELLFQLKQCKAVSTLSAISFEPIF